MKDKTYSFMNEIGESSTNKVKLIYLYIFYIFSLEKISMMISGKW